MQKKIQVLGVELDNRSAKEAMKQVVDCIHMEKMNVVEMVTMNTLAHFQNSEEDKQVFETFDIVLPSDRGILQAAGIEEERRLKEVDELLFIKMVMRYLQKNKIRVFLVCETDTLKDKVEAYIAEEYNSLQIVASASLEGCGNSHDALLNMINGAEAECVLSTISSPLEEMFISKNKSLVNARIWLGFGLLLNVLYKEKKGWEKLVEKIYRRILKREVEKEKKKNDIVNNDNILN